MWSESPESYGSARSRYATARRAVQYAAAWSLLTIASALTGCSCNSADDSADSSRPQPHMLLKQVIKRYQNADTYSDRAVVRLQYREGRRIRSDDAPLEISFDRPGRLSMRVYQVVLTSDGNRLLARVRDEQQPAPEHQR